MTAGEMKQMKEKDYKEAKLTQLEEALQRIKPRFECARASCPMNKDGQRCLAVNEWFACRRHKEP
jgi:hypothetical protein